MASTQPLPVVVNSPPATVIAALNFLRQLSHHWFAAGILSTNELESLQMPKRKLTAPKMTECNLHYRRVRTHSLRLIRLTILHRRLRKRF
jgi:hypothetical protein